MNVCDIIPNEFVKMESYMYIYVGTHDREQCRAESKTDPRLYPGYSLLRDTPSWVGSSKLGKSGGQFGQHSKKSPTGSS
jgi:hypothetical protein